MHQDTTTPHPTEKESAKTPARATSLEALLTTQPEEAAHKENEPAKNACEQDTRKQSPFSQSDESAGTSQTDDSSVSSGDQTSPEDSSPHLPEEAFETSPDSPQNTETGADTESDDRPMSLMDHLNELRRCLTKACIAVFVCFILCWAVVDPIFNTLVDPLLTALPEGSHAMYTTLPEGFFTRLFIAFVAGFFVASPVIFYQIWSFIAPGLYDEEKRFIVPIALLSALFFIGGGLFCFFIVFPYVFTFFISFATESIVAMPKVSDYLDFVLKLLFAFGLIFEMPLFTFFLSRLGLVTAQTMRRVRRYAVLAIFIIAAILTPPDVVSQLLMAGPMLLLYELSIFIAAVFGRAKPPKKEVNEQSSEESSA